MTIRNIVGFKLNQAAAMNAEESTVGFVVDEIPRCITIKAHNIRNFGVSKLVDFELSGDLQFVNEISYELNEIRKQVSGSTVFNNPPTDNLNHSFRTIKKNVPIQPQIHILDFHLNNAVKTRDCYMLHLWA